MQKKSSFVLIRSKSLCGGGYGLLVQSLPDQEVLRFFGPDHHGWCLLILLDGHRRSRQG